MSIKVIESALQTGVVLEAAVGEFLFSAAWERPGAAWEVQCMNMVGASGVITEKQLRDMVAAFKEAKTKIGEEIAMLEEMIKPYVDYMSKLGEKDE